MPTSRCFSTLTSVREHAPGLSKMKTVFRGKYPRSLFPWKAGSWLAGQPNSLCSHDLVFSRTWQRSQFGNRDDVVSRHEGDLGSPSPGPQGRKLMKEGNANEKWPLGTAMLDRQTHEHGARGCLYVLNCAFFPLKKKYFSSALSAWPQNDFPIIAYKQTFITDSLPAELRHCVKQYIASVWQISCL